MFTQYLIKTQKYDDEHLRKMVEQILACLFYATNIKEIRNQCIGLLDSLLVHFTLISLSLYNNQDESKLGTMSQANVFSLNIQQTTKGPDASSTPGRRLSNQFQQQQQPQQPNSCKTEAMGCSSLTTGTCPSSLDFMILVDCLFDVLCNDDSEYWPIVQRSILIMIETSEIVSGGASLVASGSSTASQADADTSTPTTVAAAAAAATAKRDLFLKPNLANQALFDYLAEKICQLCYERSWYAKKAG
jgi:hypothetical protein